MFYHLLQHHLHEHDEVVLLLHVARGRDGDLLVRDSAHDVDGDGDGDCGVDVLLLAVAPRYYSYTHLSHSL